MLHPKLKDAELYEFIDSDEIMLQPLREKRQNTGQTTEEIR